MTDARDRYLDTFPQWLRTLGDDAEGLLDAVQNAQAPEAARRTLAGGLNYLFKSLDLVPDGIDDIGYLDDAFVLRVAADLAARDGLTALADSPRERIVRLAADCKLLREFLGQDYARLETYVQGLRRGAARGRSVEDILGAASVLAEFVGDVRSFARSYEPLGFAREEKNLIKLKAFLDAKLPK